MRVAVVGAGWAGLSAAWAALRDGHDISLYEAARQVGGRARRIPGRLPDGTTLDLDNGQHILIGAYTATLDLLARVGLDCDGAFERLPLRLDYVDASGFRLPAWPAPWDVLWGVLNHRAWSWRERLALLQTAWQWRRDRFSCRSDLSVTDLCRRLPPRVMHELIEPLCVSALNTPPQRASAQVFLRVLHDALFSATGGSRFWLPRVDLGALLPDAVLRTLLEAGSRVMPGHRITEIARGPASAWLVNGDPHDAVIIATPPADAARLCAPLNPDWAALAQGLQHESITTVYAWQPGIRLAAPLLALRSNEAQPAQFVFDRGQLGGPAGLLAFVVSASCGDAVTLEQQVLEQARIQLGLALQGVQTVVEKRATFSCTPGLQRPGQQVAPKLLACGDYVDGPYPATLEGAVRSGLSAAAALRQW